MKHYDCVIVGGGAVGLSLALTLAQLNYKALLIEQKEPHYAADDFNARTLALSYASQRIYDMLGIWEKLIFAVPIQQVHVSVKGQYGSSRLRAEDEGVDALGFVVGLQGLEKILEDAVKAESNVDILRPATLIDKTPTPEAWQLTVSDPTCEKISCQLLIGADGIHSTLRENQSIPLQKKEYQHVALMTNLELAESHQFIAYERFLKDGAIALLPWQKQYATCVWTTTQSQAQDLMKMDDQTFLQLCQQQFTSRMSKIIACSKRFCIPLQMQLAANQVSARFLLMGNAAHTLHPIAAQGLNLSLRDIWQIRSQLVKAKSHCDVGSFIFLDEYLQSRKMDQDRVIFATDKIARFMSGGPLPSWLRALGLTMFDCTRPLKRKFTQLGMGI